MRYPIFFLNKKGNEVARISKRHSIDDTPRYTINPKCPENTYPLEYCLEKWHPVYKYTKGDNVEWITQQGKTKFDCIVRAVKVRDNLVKIVADHSANNPMPYSYFWVEPSELNLKQSVSMPYYTKSEEEVCQHNKGL